MIIGDNTANCRLTLWETDVNKLKENCSYKLSDMMVREFKGKRYLSMAKENCTMEEICDVGDVYENNDEELCKDSNEMSNIRVAAVVQLDKYYACLKCTAKVVANEDPEVGSCVKCFTKQSIDMCKQELCAQLLLKEGTTICSYKAFGKVVTDIAERAADEITPLVLLKARSFNMLQSGGIIQHINRAI